MLKQVDQITLSIDGMGCAGCASKIEKLLRQATGVQEAAVDFPRAEAQITFDPALISPARLGALLVEAGYTAPGAG